ncbi:2-deoxy-D-gluconate 3-dehydrogenase [Herbidospora sp. NBRC 101105]|nr:2-deoxy-D-gluconate 3-dehydrogenase [Herbidospora sp. NBRC 101105]
MAAVILERFRLDGKVAVVTGASSGLGVAFARGLAEAGADVAIGARRAERLEETRRLVEETGRRCVAVATDVTSPDDCAALVSAAVAELGGVDILINNAGVGTAVPALKETAEEFRAVVDVNLNGAFHMAQACARVMRPGSSIVNIGSILGETTGGLPQAAYSASKAALTGLTRDLAQQWTGRRGIRVNCLEPGFFASEMTSQYPEGYLDKALALRVPAGRVGEAEELVCAAIFLASDAGSYVTGAVLPVDGGILIT